jgi:hypothetical protein
VVRCYADSRQIWDGFHIPAPRVSLNRRQHPFQLTAAGRIECEISVLYLPPPGAIRSEGLIRSVAFVVPLRARHEVPCCAMPTVPLVSERPHAASARSVGSGRAMRTIPSSRVAGGGYACWRGASSPARGWVGEVGALGFD